MNQLSKNLIGIVTVGMLAMSFTGCGKDSGSVTGSNTETEEISTPKIEGISPEKGSIGTEITITGTEFASGARVWIGEKETSTVEVESSTKMYATVPSGIAGNTSLDVRIANTDGGDATFSSGFTAIDPVLSYVNSATKPSGNIGSTVILDGQAFGDVQGNGKVLFSDGAGGTVSAVITNPDDWTDTFIVTTVPDGAADGPIYITTEIGSSESIEFNITDAASFSPSTINWTVTTSLPSALSGQKAVYIPIEDATGATARFVHITGGLDSTATATDQALYGRIEQDGTINSWNSTAPLPDSTGYHASLAATPFNSKVSGNGYLYTLGGVNNSGDPVSSVYTASLNEDGTVNSWIANRSLPQPLQSLGAVVFRSTLYVAGGATSGNTPVSNVYKAEIDSLGNIGTWVELASLPSARAYHGFLNFGAFLYSVGGESTAESPEDGDSENNDTKLTEVVYANLDLRSGDITTAGWTLNANELGKSRSKHSTLVAGGNIFVSSGLYSAAKQGSSENVYGQINSDGTVGEFNGATGDNTLLSVGNNNLFNQAAISYIDGNGVSHVMIIGGDDVNAPGNKQKEVIFY